MEEPEKILVNDLNSEVSPVKGNIAAMTRHMFYKSCGTSNPRVLEVARSINDEDKLGKITIKAMNKILDDPEVTTYSDVLKILQEAGVDCSKEEIEGALRGLNEKEDKNCAELMSYFFLEYACLTYEKK